MDFEKVDGRFEGTQKGSKLIKSIHDSTFLLDLYVRESIQNSLDAYDKHSRARDVLVEYVLGNFSHDALVPHIPGLLQDFYEQHMGQNPQFIAIKDGNTTGLTGKFLMEEDGEIGNLRKLVFESHESKGDGNTGGSWGLGKTVFYRLGVGIVFYYSRIRLNDGQFQSRLVGALIEDEKKPNHISCGEDYCRTGMGWWGQHFQGNIIQDKIIPITDDNIISEFLQLFNIEPYINQETGTCVIVPYVELDDILEEERSRISNIDNQDGDTTINEGDRPWLNNVKDYLKISILRWYYPRLDNDYFHYGPKLYVRIRDTRDNTSSPIILSSEYSLFGVMQALYNRAALYNDGLPSDYSDSLSVIGGAEVKRIEITQRHLLAGCMSYIKISNQDMCGPNPYMLLGMNKLTKSIVAFTRSLGMIVWFENASVDSGIRSNDECILAQFVLNSECQVEDNNTLEQYIRKTEGPSHNSWKVEKKGYAYNLTNKVLKSLKESFAETPVMGDSHVNSLGRELAKLLTPEARSTSTTSTRGGSKGKIKAKQFTYLYKVANYNPFTIELDFTIDSSFNDDITIDLHIASDGSSISFKEWKEDVSNEYPFYIESASVTTGGTTVELNADSDVNYISTDSSKWKYELQSLDGYSSHRLQLHRSSQLIISKENLEPQDPQPGVSNEKIQASLVLQIDDSKYMPSIEVTTSNKK